MSDAKANRNSSSEKKAKDRESREQTPTSSEKSLAPKERNAVADPTRKQFYSAARLWAIVLAANLCGTFLTAAMAIHGSILPPLTPFRNH